MPHDPDPYQQFLADAIAEWANDQDTEYRRFYPETTDTKENNR